MSDSYLNFFKHVAISPDDQAEMKSLKRKIMLSQIQSHLEITQSKLLECALFLVHEMHVGLLPPSAGHASSLRMVPSYVYRNPPHADGTFYAIDFGGSNFRFIRMVVENNKLVKHSIQHYAVPKTCIEGTAQNLFGFIADSLKDFYEKEEKDSNAGGVTNVGFTFSFPVNLVAINKGILVRWTKGFNTSGVIGEEVCNLLQVELNKRGVKLNVAALCNDTVGTQVAKYFDDESTELGIIIGTGTNGAYWERSERILKEPSVTKNGKLEMSISTEFGNFDSLGPYAIPVTPFDKYVDSQSNNAHEQIYEKCTSGMYIGEVARVIIVALSTSNGISSIFKDKLNKPYGFTTEDMGLISGDDLPGYPLITEILNKYKITCDEKDIEAVKIVCQSVVKRSARLGGMAISGLLMKSHKTSNAIVAVDGSVYEKIPKYKGYLHEAIKEILGDQSNIQVVLQKEGSGFGAGFIAALQ